MSEIKKLEEYIISRFGDYFTGLGAEITRMAKEALKEHDALVAEVERLEVYATGLKEDMFYWKERAGKTEVEVERLKEYCENCSHGEINLKGSISCSVAPDYVEYGGYCDEYVEEKDGAKDENTN
jgi:hypothetical protein